MMVFSVSESMIKITAAAIVLSSQKSIDGFVLPDSRLVCKRKMPRNTSASYSTKYDGCETINEQEGIPAIISRDEDVKTTAKTQIDAKTTNEEIANGNEVVIIDENKEKQKIDRIKNKADGMLLDDLDDSKDNFRRRKISNRNLRMQVYSYLAEPVIEVRIIGLVLLSCFLQAIDTLENIPVEVHQGINVVDTLFVYIFAIEFFLRWWSAGRFQFRYLTKPLVSIDAIVVILPLILSGILPLWDFAVMAGLIPWSLPGWLLSSSSTNSALLNLRLLRILKFQRVLTNRNTYMNFEMALGMKKTDVRPYQLQLARVVISIFTLVSVSTGLIYTAEYEANPMFTDYFTALYFGLTTLTTVGFGDITPVTFQGRIVVMASILAGVIVIPAQAASL